MISSKGRRGRGRTSYLAIISCSLNCFLVKSVASTSCLACFRGSCIVRAIL